jgi:hypothetical protein
MPPLLLRTIKPNRLLIHDLDLEHLRGLGNPAVGVPSHGEEPPPKKESAFLGMQGESKAASTTVWLAGRKWNSTMEPGVA